MKETEVKRTLYQDIEAFKVGIEVGKETIDKACEWMESIDFEMEYQYSDDGYDFFDANKFIADFRKAMLKEK